MTEEENEMFINKVLAIKRKNTSKSTWHKESQDFGKSKKLVYIRLGNRLRKELHKDYMLELASDTRLMLQIRKQNYGFIIYPHILKRGRRHTCKNYNKENSETRVSIFSHFYFLEQS